MYCIPPGCRLGQETKRRRSLVSQTMACTRSDRIRSNAACVDDDADIDGNVGNGVDDNMVGGVDHDHDHHVYDDDDFDHSTWDYEISSNGSKGMREAISSTRMA